MSQEHLLALSKLCRVCGAPFKNKKGPLGCKHPCSNRRTDLLDVFEINISSDSPSAYCLCQWLHTSQSPTCPCCFSQHISEPDIEIPSPVTLRALGSLEVTCCHCNKRGYLKDHKTHVDSKCTSDDFRLTMSELLGRPQDLPLSPLETALQSSLIKRSMRSSETNTLQVKIGGQVSQKHTLVYNTNIAYMHNYDHFGTS